MYIFFCCCWQRFCFRINCKIIWLFKYQCYHKDFAVFCIALSLNTIYRSRQYYESKVHHNTEVTWFSTFRHFPLKLIFLSKLQKKVRAPFITLLLAPSNPKLYSSQLRFEFFDINIRLLRNSEPFKIRLLQCYAVLWTFNIKRDLHHL